MVRILITIAILSACVIARAETSTITASPNPCVLESGSCQEPVALNWSSPDYACLFLQGNSTALNCGTQYGNYSYTSGIASGGATFELHANASIASTLLASVTVATTQATSWTVNFNNTSGTFSDSESNSSTTANGNITRGCTGTGCTPAGLIKKTMTSCSGSSCPPYGNDGINPISSGNPLSIYGLEMPGIMFAQPPTLSTEKTMIYTPAAGVCPTSSFPVLFVASQWDTNNPMSVNSSRQLAFGTGTWDNTNTQFTITEIYSVAAPPPGAGGCMTSPYCPVAGFYSFSVPFTTCTAGAFDNHTTGVGDRGGWLYFNKEGSGFFRTNANHGFTLVPQTILTSQSSFAGNYAVYRAVQPGASEVTYKPMRFTIPTSGTLSGNALTSTGLQNLDGTLLDGTYAETITNIKLNNPVNGMFTGTIYHNGARHGTLACIVSYADASSGATDSRNVLYCVGEAPENANYPLNLMLVSDPGNWNSLNSSDFGTVIAGNAGTTSITVTNDGTGVLNNISVGSTSGSSAFTVTGGSCIGANLAPGGSCTIDFHYAAPGGQAYSNNSATITFNYTDNQYDSTVTGSFSISVSGENTPVLQWSGIGGATGPAAVSGSSSDILDTSPPSIQLSWSSTALISITH